ncbi:MAG: Hsp20 family protein [Pseudohongiellaceae bacterium]
MTTFDFAPLYRSTVGFDHLSSLLDAVNQRERTQPGYPPYNIERLDQDRYRITMAVAGFVQDELDIQSERQTLTVRGAKADEDEGRNYMHRGIATRNFERVFELADHVKVTAAKLESGLLHIELMREIPEAMKPRSIPIDSTDGRLINVDKNDDSSVKESKSANKAA